MPLTVTKFAPCAGCACVCDDIELHSDGQRIIEAKNACEMGRSWFLDHKSDGAAAMVDGKVANVTDAIEAAAKILNEAHAPLVETLGPSRARRA